MLTCALVVISRHFDDAVLSVARVERAALQRLMSELLSAPAVQVLALLEIGNHHDHVEVAVVAMHAVIDHEAADRMEFLQGLQRVVGAAASPAKPRTRCGRWLARAVSDIDCELAKDSGNHSVPDPAAGGGGTDRITKIIRRSHSRCGGDILWWLDPAPEPHPADTVGPGVGALRCG